MRLNISIILSLLFAIGLVAFGFTFYQSSAEKAKLNNDLESRTIQVTNEIFIHDALFFEKLGQNNINFFSDSINRQFNLLGLQSITIMIAFCAAILREVLLNIRETTFPNQYMQILLLGIFLNQKAGKYINISGR